MRHLPVEGRFTAAFDSWRDSALRAISAGWPADTIEWSQEPLKSGTQGLFDYASSNVGAGHADIGGNTAYDSTGRPHCTDDLTELRSYLPAPLRVSKEMAGLLSDAALYRDAQRWSFLYHLLWRWAHGDRTCASAADVDGGKLYRMAKAVRRDKHDMIAYVRFRQPGDAADVNQTRQADQTHQTHDRPDYLAEFAPEHDVLAWAADYFAERMGKASWVISTPDAVAMSDGSSLSVISKPNSLLRADDAYGNGSGNIAVGPSVPPAQEAVKQAQISEWSLDAESLWLIYYRSTFNPARVDRRGLEQRMPVRHWRGLPEAVLIPGMLSAAHSGQRALAQSHQIGVMPGKSVLIDPAQAQPRRDPSSTLDQCRRCELWRTATQVVPGCGPRTARIMLIGEQPGDQEDLAGRPFVGPAGKLLDSAMQDAGLSRDTVYMTNAVKHFKWEPKGKRRIHKTPQQREIEACRGWLEEELATVQPAVVVALGASALSSIHRSLNRAPGMLGNGVLLATRHPAYALRQADPEAKLAIFNEIAETLRAAVRHCEGLD